MAKKNKEYVPDEYIARYHDPQWFGQRLTTPVSLIYVHEDSQGDDYFAVEWGYCITPEEYKQHRHE